MFNKNTSRFRKKQVTPNPFPLKNSAIALCPVQLTELPANCLSVLNFYLATQKQRRFIFPSLDTTARHLGISARTVARANAKLKEIGLLGWRRRYDNSNVYVISRWFSLPSVRRSLERFLPALLGMAVTLLMCPPILTATPENKGVSTYTKNSDFKSYSSSPTSSFLSITDTLRTIFGSKIISREPSMSDNKWYPPTEKEIVPQRKPSAVRKSVHTPSPRPSTPSTFKGYYRADLDEMWERIRKGEKP